MHRIGRSAVQVAQSSGALILIRHELCYTIYHLTLALNSETTRVSLPRCHHITSSPQHVALNLSITTIECDIN